MSHQEWIILIGAVIAVALIVICAVGLTVERRKRKDFTEEEFTAPIYDTVRAEVVDVKCDMHYEGVKSPKLIKEFAVFFSSKNGKTVKLDVPKEYYGAFEVGRHGVLTMTDGKFISFTADGESKC